MGRDFTAAVVGRRQTVCRAAAAVLRRPWLTRLVVRLLAQAPVLAAPGDSLPELGKMLGPAFLFRFHFA